MPWPESNTTGLLAGLLTENVPPAHRGRAYAREKQTALAIRESRFLDFDRSAMDAMGSPVEGNSIDPASGCLPLTAGTVAVDPRYPGGLPAGATPGHEYVAQTCLGNLMTPDLATGHFDTFGQFVEPTQPAYGAQTNPFQAFLQRASQDVKLQRKGARMTCRG